MRNPIWRIRALVMVTLLFWQCGKTATGPEQQTLRERLIGTWWRQADEPESSGVDAVVLRFRDDGFMTSRLISFQEGGSQEWEVLYARWELENDSLTITLVQDEDGLSSLSFTVMIAFEDEALILPEPYSDERYTYQPGGIPPEAIPEGNALSGTVTYSDGPYNGILVAAYKFESRDGGEDVFLVDHGGAVLLVGGEWDIWGLDDGVWFVWATVFGEDGDAVAGSIVVSEAGDVIADVMLEDLETISLADFDGIPLEGGQQVVTGIDIALKAPGRP